MNSINNIYNQLLQEAGYSFEINIIFVMVFPGINLIGFLLNLLNLIILKDERFNNLFYKYLKVYCINSLMINLNNSSLVISQGGRFLAISNSYAAVVFFSYINIPIQNTFCLYGTILDILITTERLSIYISSNKTVLAHLREGGGT